MSNFNSFLKTRQMTTLELRRLVQQNGRIPKIFPESGTADEERSYIVVATRSDRPRF
jgi:hypothetical protein